MPTSHHSPCPERLQGQQLAERALSRYAHTRDGTATLICHSENLTYRIDTPRTRYALRIQRPGNHTPAALQSELSWIRALHAEGFPVAAPYQGDDGQWVQHLDETHDAILFTWIAGQHPQPSDDLPYTLRTLGELTARLHTHSQRWIRPAGFTRPQWTPATMTGPDGLWGDWRAAVHDVEDTYVIAEAVNKIHGDLAHYGQSPERFGLIHADLRLSNLLVHQQHVHIIDFDDCGEGWWLHDLAATLSFHEHHPDVRLWINHWCEGYALQRPLSCSDLDIVISLIMQRRVQLLAWSASHAGNDTVSALPADWHQHTVALCRRYLVNAI